MLMTKFYSYVLKAIEELFLILYATWIVLNSKLSRNKFIIWFYLWHLFTPEIKNDESEVTGGIIYSNLFKSLCNC